MLQVKCLNKYIGPFSQIGYNKYAFDILYICDSFAVLIQHLNRYN